MSIFSILLGGEDARSARLTRPTPGCFLPPTCWFRRFSPARTSARSAGNIAKSMSYDGL